MDFALCRILSKTQIAGATLFGSRKRDPTPPQAKQLPFSMTATGD
jgi:hypothetical protein